MANSSVLNSLNLCNLTTRELNEIKEMQCLKCTDTYKFPIDKDNYLAHLYLQHRIIIGDEEKVAILEDYLIYWRDRMKG